MRTTTARMTAARATVIAVATGGVLVTFALVAWACTLHIGDLWFCPNSNTACSANTSQSFSNSDSLETSKDSTDSTAQTFHSKSADLDPGRYMVKHVPAAQTLHDAGGVVDEPPVPVGNVGATPCAAGEPMETFDGNNAVAADDGDGLRDPAVFDTDSALFNGWKEEVFMPWGGDDPDGDGSNSDDTGPLQYVTCALRADVDTGDPDDNASAPHHTVVTIT